ncbi:MAG: UDP-N-acetylmuramate--L-alanine ligase [Phycisphaerales bacterium]
MSRDRVMESKPQQTAEAHAFRGRDIYMIGIGGSGMNGLARLLTAAGARCRGCEAVSSDVTETLIRDGIGVDEDCASISLPDQCNLVITTAAAPPSHRLLVEARQRNIMVLRYAEALGQLQQLHTSIAIAGSHGKSTTAAMLTYVLREAELGPGMLIGASCPQLGGGCCIGAATVPHGPFAGQPGFLIAEACEFNRSFHNHRPQMALINNLEADHLDIYGSFENVVDAFNHFAKLLPAAEDGGRLLIPDHLENRDRVLEDVTAEVFTFGNSAAADYVVTVDPAGTSCSLRCGASCDDSNARLSWSIRMPGVHNLLNSAAAAILAQWCGATNSQIVSALQSFNGLDRRTQHAGDYQSADGSAVPVYDDYGHHPTEIRSALAAIRAAERTTRLVCVFQPHQHSRTRLLLDDFATSFSAAEVVIIPHIYFVRDPDEEQSRISAKDLVTAVNVHSHNAIHIDGFDDVVSHLRSTLRSGDCLVVMGAGPVWKITRKLLAQSHQATHITKDAHLC